MGVWCLECNLQCGTNGHWSAPLGGAACWHGTIQGMYKYIIYKHMYIHTYTCTHEHMHAYAHMHKHIHIQQVQTWRQIYKYASNLWSISDLRRYVSWWTPVSLITAARTWVIWYMKHCWRRSFTPISSRPSWAFSSECSWQQLVTDRKQRRLWTVSFMSVQVSKVCRSSYSMYTACESDGVIRYVTI